MGGTVVHDSVTLREKIFVCKSNFPEVRNEVMLTEAVEKPSPRRELLASCEVPNSLAGETYQIGLNGDEVGIAYMKSVETRSTGRLLNWTEGAVDTAQELVKPSKYCARGVITSEDGARLRLKSMV
ncbi:hypothetical protein CMV_029343 [Castanea mollissima]|uniref:Uncharacterized protein n=1 Tax=Castanea mollissima TaxID=60419 RepID=A0A8J4V7H7_9ROSI|nr:hypothetical protein CMV_029343 [Castanea mollissima]